jgi:hypothetical protein
MVARTSLNGTLHLRRLSCCHLFSFSSFYDAVTAAEILWLLMAYGTVLMTKDKCGGVWEGYVMAFFRISFRHFLFSWRDSPPVGLGLLIHEVVFC